MIASPSRTAPPNEFPNAPAQIARGFHQAFLRRAHGVGPTVGGDEPVTREGAQTPHRAPFGGGSRALLVQLRTSQDLAIVGLMLLRRAPLRRSLGFESRRSVVSEAQLRVRGKGNKCAFAAGAGKHTTAGSLWAAGTAEPSGHRRALRLAQRTCPRSPHDPREIAVLVPLSSSDHRHQARQPASVSSHLCLGHGARRYEPARAHAINGSHRHPNHAALCASYPTRCLSSVCTRGGAAPSPPAQASHEPRAPPSTPPSAGFRCSTRRSIPSAPRSVPIRRRHYRGTGRDFLSDLGTDHPELNRLQQLRREPHVLGWMSRLHSQVPPLATASYINRLIALRAASSTSWLGLEQLSEVAHLIRREDIPRLPRRLPRPLTAEQDQLLQQEFLRRNDRACNAFLLIRHTGMRIGECADLSLDCLRSPRSASMGRSTCHSANSKRNAWSPWIPSCVNSFSVSGSFVPMIPCLRMDGSWPARGTKEALVRQLRDYLHQVCDDAWPFHSHRPAPDEAHLRHRNAPSRVSAFQP